MWRVSGGAIALRVELIGRRTVAINVERIMAIDLEEITRREFLLTSGSVLAAASSPAAATGRRRAQSHRQSALRRGPSPGAHGLCSAGHGDDGQGAHSQNRYVEGRGRRGR